MYFSNIFARFIRSSPQKSDFSVFFHEASLEEQKRRLEGVVKKANDDQKKIVDEYRSQKLHRKTA